jgi:hypothetical protein
MKPQITTPSDEDLSHAFCLGACAAYDDLGFTEPPWYFGSEQEFVETMNCQAF